MVKVKLFANFREVAGEREVSISAKSVEELVEKLRQKYPGMEELLSAEEYLHVSVNGSYITPDNYKNMELGNQDVVAVFPPVSGG
ncbi:MAG: ubiquitin-like small modifier protein 1 [Archaeoglobaceae archaeon]